MPLIIFKVEKSAWKNVRRLQIYENGIKNLQVTHTEFSILFVAEFRQP